MVARLFPGHIFLVLERFTPSNVPLQCSRSHEDWVGMLMWLMLDVDVYTWLLDMSLCI